MSGKFWLFLGLCAQRNLGDFDYFLGFLFVFQVYWLVVGEDRVESRPELVGSEVARDVRRMVLRTLARADLYGGGFLYFCSQAHHLVEGLLYLLISPRAF